MWQSGNVTPCKRPKTCLRNGLLHASNIASVAMLLDKVAMLLADPRADLPYRLQNELLHKKCLFLAKY